MERGAPQLRHFPSRYTQVTSGMFKYHGMEYLQCGQWEGGKTMLWSSGSRWIQTLRKLPTMEPNTKNTIDQKWNGIAAQLCGSNVALNIRALKSEGRGPRPEGIPKAELRRAVVSHKDSSPVPGAWFPGGRFARSTIPRPWRPGTATCRDHWRCGSQRLWRP